MLDSELLEAVLPPAQRIRGGDRKRDRGDARVARARRPRHRPVEEGDLGSRPADLVPIEQVVGGDVVLVHRLLDQPEAEDVGVEVDVLAGAGGDRGHVVESVELHFFTINNMDFEAANSPRVLRRRPGYEAWFLGTAHSDNDINRTIEAAKKAAAKLS